MSPKRIFITGASGCIGHYIAEALIQQTPHELFLLVRNPEKLRVDTSRPGVTVLQGDLHEIDRFGKLLRTMDVAILTATAWGGVNEVYDTNVVKTIRLLNLLDVDRCEQAIYFSTASILDRHNHPLKQAGEIGTDYIKSKYICHQQISRLAISPKITTLFPTLVFGGDAQKPYSHITAGIPEVTNWAWLIRFLQADGSFHFIHGQDIASVVRQLVDRPPTAGDPRELVLGNPAMTLNGAIEEVCAYLGKRIYFRLPLSIGLANLLIRVFNIQMAAWDRFCLDYRHFTYEDAVSPAAYELPEYCPTFTDLLKLYQPPVS